MTHQIRHETRYQIRHETRRLGRSRATLATVTAATALAVALAGCGGAATSTSTSRSSVSPPRTSAGSATTTQATPATMGVTPSQLKGLLSDYDRRNNPALDKANRDDPSGWATADDGPVLASDLFSTALRKAMKESGTKVDPSPAWYHRPVASVGGAENADGLGPWVLARVRSDVPGDDEPGRDEEYLRVMTGGSGTRGWKMFASLRRDTLVPVPADLPAGADVRLTPEQRQKLANTASEVVYALGNGNVDAFGQANAIVDLRTAGIETDSRPDLNGRISYQCWGWGDRTRQNAASAVLVGTPALRSQRAVGATVALLTLDCDWTTSGYVDVPEPLAKVTGLSPGEHRSVRTASAVQFALVLPDRGKPSIAGWDLRWQLPR